MKRILFFIFQCLDSIQWKFSLFGNPCFGRKTQWTPVECEECGWYGPVRWAQHGYGDDGSGEDVVAEEYCPKCGQMV